MNLIDDNPNPAPSLHGKQLSLLELFFMTTCAAVLVGVYQFLSPMIAGILGCLLVSAGCVRWLGCYNLLTGGLTGFAVAFALSLVWIIFSQLAPSASIALVLFCPATGYVLGAMVAELSHNLF